MTLDCSQVSLVTETVMILVLFLSFLVFYGSTKPSEFGDLGKSSFWIELYPAVKKVSYRIVAGPKV